MTHDISRERTVLVVDFLGMKEIEYRLECYGINTMCTLPVRSKITVMADVFKDIDGLILTGGGDVDPSLYSAFDHIETYGIDKERDAFEIAAIETAINKNIPILGICRGAQIINVALGGNLWLHIDDHPRDVGHWGRLHPIKLAKSYLKKNLPSGQPTFMSYHHQAIRNVGRGLYPVAWSRDGLIEAVESVPGTKPYILGVQFHPEMGESQYDDGVFKAFIRAVCGGRLPAKQEVKRKSWVTPAWIPPAWSQDPHDPAHDCLWEGDDYEYEKWSRRTLRDTHSYDCVSPPCGWPDDCNENFCVKFGLKGITDEMDKSIAFDAGEDEDG